MRVYCTACGEKAKITSTETISKGVKKLYCVCLNAECGHSFAMMLSFDHTISPSALHLSEEKRAAVRCSTFREVQLALN